MSIKMLVSNPELLSNKHLIIFPFKFPGKPTCRLSSSSLLQQGRKFLFKDLLKKNPGQFVNVTASCDVTIGLIYSEQVSD